MEKVEIPIEDVDSSWIRKSVNYAFKQAQDNATHHINKVQEMLQAQVNSGNEMMTAANKIARTPTLRRFIEEDLGYPCEKHVYVTQDGYINTLYRIPG